MSQKVTTWLKLALGIASAIAFEILAKGAWAHAVWVPVALMLATDFQKVFGTAEVTKILSNQRVRFLLGLASAGAVHLLTKGPWSHTVWVPVAIMLFTNIQQVFDPTAAPVAAASTPAPAASSEAVTPNEKPPAT